jgi:anthranilate synthase component 1
MSTAPDFATVEALYQQGKGAVLWVRQVADLDTPVSASLKLMEEDEPFLLLESVQGGETRGRYSILGLHPDRMWRCRGEVAETRMRKGKVWLPYQPDARPPLASLRAFWQEAQMEIPDALPPMAGGVFGMLTYEMIRHVERLPEPKADTLGIPDALLMRPSSMLVFDNVADALFIMAIIRPTAGITARTAYDEACARIETLQGRLAAPLPPHFRVRDVPPQTLDFQPNVTREQYHGMVEVAKEHIRAGDIFQVVPSQRFSAPFTQHPFAFYRSLRHLNPSPFLVYLHCGEFAVVASSPEILVRLRDNTVTIRPIAGTRPRGTTPEQDQQLADELLADPKECAEHLMLLDLGRNDVGRVSQPGTVQVTERMVIERYSHVMHIVSNVTGTIDPRFDAIDALMAGFPAGTVSGAPKIRAMEIIHALEPERRAFYAGCLGYFGANGGMDTCIALRTALIKDGILHAQAGGGVVADSDPEAEYQESCNKAKAVIRAAEMAVRFGGSD